MKVYGFQIIINIKLLFDVLEMKISTKTSKPWTSLWAHWIGFYAIWSHFLHGK